MKPNRPKLPVVDTEDIDLMLDGYATAALWSTNDNSDPSGGKPLDATYGVKDIEATSLARMRRDCKDFLRRNLTDIQLFMVQTNRPLDYVGHDFWLTRNGHGTGFWDRQADDVGDRLADASKAYGEQDMYDDDGKVWVA